MAEEEGIRLSEFKMSIIKSNTVVTIIGKNTNIKSIYKDYGKYFDSMSQLKNIMEDLKDNQSLVIDETSPRNRVQDLLYIYTNK